MAYLVKKMAALCWLRSCLGAAEMPDVSLVPYQRVAASKLLWVLHKYLIFSCRVLHKYRLCCLYIYIYIYTNVISWRPTYIFQFFLHVSVVMPHEAIIECDAQGPQVKKLSQ